MIEQRMSTTPLRLSPLHDALDALHPAWGTVDDMPVALRFGDAAVERAHAARLGLCDASVWARTTIKGPAAADFLQSNSVPVPPQVLAVAPLAGGGVVARTGGMEFFVEDAPGGGLVTRLSAAVAAGTSEVYEVLRQDASILVSGELAVAVLRETCGFEFHPVTTSTQSAESALGPRASRARSTTPPGVIMTRVAGVSALILPRELNGLPLFQLWLDGTYGDYLWETLLEIVRQHGGEPVGLGTFFPSLE